MSIEHRGQHLFFQSAALSETDGTTRTILAFSPAHRKAIFSPLFFRAERERIAPSARRGPVDSQDGRRAHLPHENIACFERRRCLRRKVRDEPRAPCGGRRLYLGPEEDPTVEIETDIERRFLHARESTITAPRCGALLSRRARRGALLPRPARCLQPVFPLERSVFFTSFSPAAILGDVSRTPEVQSWSSTSFSDRKSVV